MKDLRRVTLVAIIFLVVLRIAIGWQFLYEGLWKVSTLSTSQPWTSEGYLKNAQGPFRDYFRNMVGDPDDLGWLDFENVSQKWYDWRDRFTAHYQLTDEQKESLERLLNGTGEVQTDPQEVPPTPRLRQPLPTLPESVKLETQRVVTYDANAKQLITDSPILPTEEAFLKAMVDVTPQGGSFIKSSDETADPDPAEVEFYQAVTSLAQLSRNLSVRHKLAAMLLGDPENAGVYGQLNERGSFDIHMGTLTLDQLDEKTNLIRYGRIQEYKDLLRDYQQALKQAALDYQYDHATTLGRKLAILHGSLVTPIKTLDADLKASAIRLLTGDQLAKDRLPAPKTRLSQADFQVMWGLTIVGALLIMGLLTRVAAVAGAVLMVLFYVVMPPWPGVPPAPGPEHSFIINKNLVEALALLALAALPTGSWFGVDALFSGFLCRRKNKPAVAASQKVTPPPAAKSTPPKPVNVKKKGKGK